MKKIGKRFWALFLIFTMLLGYVPEGTTFFANVEWEYSDQIAEPVSSKTSGIYKVKSLVTFLSSDDAQIYYTLDGKDPTISNSTLYDEYVSIEGEAGKSITTTLKAIAVKEVDGKYLCSKVKEYEFTIQRGSTVTLIWEGLLAPENITDATEFTEGGVTKYKKSWAIEYGQPFTELKCSPTSPDAYYFPAGYGSIASNGIRVERVDSETIRVYGTPIADVEIELVTPSVIIDPDASEDDSGDSSEGSGDSSEGSGDSSEGSGDSSEGAGDGETPEEDDNALYFSYSPSEIQYGESITIVAAGGYGSGKVKYESSNTNVATVDSKGKVTIVGIGEFYIKATKEASDGYKAHSKETDVIKATKRKITVENIEVVPRPYDGTDKVTVNDGELAGIFVDADGVKDDVKLVISSTEGTLQSASAGTDKPLKTLPTYSITGADADKYELEAPEAEDFKVTISKMELTLVDFAVSEKNYDGTKKATISNKGKLDTTNLTDTLKAQVAKLSVAYTDEAVSFESANVARDEDNNVIPTKVKVDATQFALVGEGAENFTVAPFECSATIKPLALNVYVEKAKYENATKLLADTVYEEFEVKAKGVLEGETLSLPKVKVITEITVELGEREYANAIQYVDANYGTNYDVTENTTLTIEGTTPPLDVNKDLIFQVGGKDVDYEPDTWRRQYYVKPAVDGNLISFDGVEWTTYYELGNFAKGSEVKDLTKTIYLKDKETGIVSSAEIKFKIDKTNPTGEVKVETDLIKSFLNYISFGFFFKENKEFHFTAEDTGSGVASIQYVQYSKEQIEKSLESGTAPTVKAEDWQTAETWVTQDGKTEFIVYGTKGNDYVFRVKITDNVGNAISFLTTGVALDEELKVIVEQSQLEYRNGSKKYGEPKFYASLEHNEIQKIEINGVKVGYEIDGDNIYLTDKEALESILYSVTTPGKPSAEVDGVIYYYPKGHAGNAAAVATATFKFKFKQLIPLQNVTFVPNAGIVDSTRVYDGKATEDYEVPGYTDYKNKVKDLIFNSVKVDGVANDSAVLQVKKFVDGEYVDVDTMRNVGEYKLYMLVPETETHCYDEYDISGAIYKITPKTLTFEPLKAIDREYKPGGQGGYRVDFEKKLTLIGVVVGDEVYGTPYTSTYEWKGYIDSCDVGEYKVGYDIKLESEDDDAANYQIKELPTVKVKITPCKIKVNVGFKDESKFAENPKSTSDGMEYTFWRGAFCGLELKEYENGKLYSNPHPQDGISVTDLKVSWNIDPFLVGYENKQDLVATIDGKINDGNGNYELESSVKLGKVRFKGEKYALYSNSHDIAIADLTNNSKTHYINYYEHGALIFVGRSAEGYQVSNDDGENFYNMIIYTDKEIETVDDLTALEAYKKLYKDNIISYFTPVLTGKDQNCLIVKLNFEGSDHKILNLGQEYHSICVKNLGGGLDEPEKDRTTDEFKFKVLLDNEPVVLKSQTLGIAAKEIKENTASYYYIQNSTQINNGIVMDLEVEVGESGIGSAKLWDGVNKDSTLNGYSSSTSNANDPSKIEIIDDGVADGIANIRITLAADSPLLGKPLYFNATNRAYNYLADKEGTIEEHEQGHLLGYIIVNNDPPCISATYGDTTSLSTEKVDSFDEKQAVTVTLSHAGVFEDLEGFVKIETTLNGNPTTHVSSDVKGSQTIKIDHESLDDGENILVVTATDLCGNTATKTYKFIVRQEQQPVTITTKTPVTYGDSLNVSDFVLSGGSADLIKNATYQIIDGEGVATLGDDGKTITLHKAGTFKIKAYVPGNDVYLPTEVTTSEITVAKREVTISGLKAETKPYDGDTDIDLDGEDVAYSNVLENDIDGFKAAVKVPNKGTSDSKDAGDTTVTVPEFTFVEGSDFANKYELAPYGTLNVTIEKRPLQLVVTGSNYGTGNTVTVDKGTYVSKIGLIVALAENSGLVAGDTFENTSFALPTVDVSSLDLMTVHDEKVVYLPFEKNTGNPTDNYTFENSTVAINLTVKSVEVKDEYYNISGTPGTNGWYTSDVTITPKEPYDKISQGNVFDTEAKSDKIDLTVEQIHNLLISLRDEDDLGTIADGRSLEIKIDKKAPTVSNVLYGTAIKINDTYYVSKGAVTITADIVDSVSNIANVYFVYGEERIDMTPGNGGSYSVTLSEEGTYNGKIVAVDNAGLTTEFTCASILIEDDAPVINTTINGTKGSDEYYEQAPTVSVQVSDNGSALKFVTYTVNGGTEQTVTIDEGDTSATFDITTLTQGVNNISIIATDRAGNTTTNTTTVKVTKNQGALSVSLTPIDVVSSGKYTYGDTYQVVVGQDPDKTNGALTYVSTNSSVAEVDANGKVTIVGVGDFEITVTKAATTGYFHTSVTTKKFTTVKRPVTITGIDAYDRPYDTKVSVNIYTDKAKLEGLAPFEDEASKVSFGTLPGTGTMTDSNVGKGKPVSIEKIELTGDKANYYELTQPKITVDINPVVLNVSVQDVKINKGQNITKLELVISGFLTGDSEESLGSEFVRPTVAVDGKVDTMNTATNWFKVAYTGGDASNNYTFNFDETVNLRIQTVNIQPGDYSVKDGKNLAEWNKDELVIIPEGNYKEISLDGENWGPELSLNEGNTSVTFCLRHEDGTVTETTSINYKLDTTAPTVKFNYNKLFQDGLNGILGQIYNLFFKNNLNVTLNITEELSGIVKKQYQVVSGTEYSNDEEDWENYYDAIGITITNKKALIFVRLEDAAGNVSILNSDGVVVYQDSAASNVDVEYTKTSPYDLALGITFYGNTIADVKLDGESLVNNEYVITGNGIEMKNEILDGLSAGIHYVEVFYNPLDVPYVDSEVNEAPDTTVFNVTVKLAQLTKNNLSCNIPEDLVYDGNAKEANVTCNVNGIGKITVKYYDAAGNEVEAPTNVGTYTVKASVKAGTLYGPLEETVVGSFTITAKELTLRDLVAENREYNGSKSVVLKGGTLVGICGNDDVTPVIPATGTLVDANAAKGKPVSVEEITLDGEDALNYTLKQPTGITVDISKVTLSVSVNPVEIKKGQAIPTLTVSVTGFVNGENTSLAGFKAPTATPANKVNTKNEEITSFDVVFSGGTATDNYKFDLSNTIAQITINTVEAKIVVAPSDLTGWINGNITITPGEGFTLISTDGVNWKESIVLTDSASAEVTVYTGKADGTLSEAKKVAYKIDKDVPVIGNTTYPNDIVVTDDKVVGKDEFDVNVVVSDAHSDVSEVTYTLHLADGTTVTEDAILALKGNTKYAIIEVPEEFVGTISMVVKDNVGNIKETNLENGKTFITDAIAPEVNITLDGVEVADGASLKCTDTIAANVADAHSGIKEFAYYVNNVKVDTINLAVGENIVKVVAKDYAGNETTKVVTITVKHSWSTTPEFTWADDYTSATATFDCVYCDKDITVNCDVTSSTNAATCEADGETVYTAKVTFNGVEYTDTKTVAIGKLGHAYGAPVFTWAANNTATATFTCTNDASHKVTENCVVTSVTEAATCEADGQTVYTAKVTFNGTTYTDTKTVTIEKLGHAYGTPVFTWNADNTATATFTCTRDAGHVEVVTATVNPVTTNPTCTEDGQTVYTAIVTFEGRVYTDEKTVEIEKLGHAYGAPVFTWNADNTATAVFTCANDASHKVTENCVVTSSTTAATCETAGQTVYTAKVTFEGEEYTGTKTVVIEKLGHVYSTPVFAWTAENTATATFTCTRDAEHVEVVNATVTYETEDATCETAGEIVYTASVTFEGKVYTDTKTVEKQSLGHAYGEPVFTWTADNTATAVFTCANDASHKVTENCIVTSSTTAATCETAGQTVYTAKVTFNGTTYTDTKTVAIEKLGHSYGTPVFAWTADNTATATFTCTRDGHETVVTATVNPVTTNPTCTEDGQIVYTAIVTFEGKVYTDEQTKVLPATGHAYEAPVYNWSEDNSKVEVTFGCENCDHKETVTDEEISKVTTDPTCETAGKHEYTGTVTFNGTEYTDTKVEVIDALGHTYGEAEFTWTEDFSGVEATFECETCGDKEVVTGVVTSETTDPSCEEDGKVVYTGTVTFEGETITDEQTEVLSATGHTYGNVVFEWTIDNQEAEVTLGCEDCDDTIVKEAEVVREVIKEATGSEKGEVLYTATVVVDEKTYTDTKKVYTNIIESTDKGDGSITTEITVGEDVPTTSIDNLTTEFAESLLTEEQLKDVENGEDVVVYLQVENINDTVNETDKELVEEQVDTIVEEIIDELYIVSKDQVKKGIQFVDLSLFMKIGNAKAEKMSSTNGKDLEITIEVPEDMRSENMKRNYYIIRVHDNNEVTILDAKYNKHDGTLSFKTNKFSTYAIAYTDVTDAEVEEKPEIKPEEKPEIKPEEKPENKPVEKPEDPEDPKAPKTGDSTNVMLWILLMATGCGMVVLGKRKKSNF